MKFTDLIQIIRETDTALKQGVLVAVNQSVTFRNWLVGFYIFEFEQNGEDRAKYGEKLLKNISDQLTLSCKKRICISQFKTLQAVLYRLPTN